MGTVGRLLLRERRKELLFCMGLLPLRWKALELDRLGAETELLRLAADLLLFLTLLLVLAVEFMEDVLTLLFCRFKSLR